MKTFYEMLELMEADQENASDQGLGDVGSGSGAQVADQSQMAPEMSQQQQSSKPKHYMFFSNLKVIKERVEAILSMDPSQVDALLDDGHDWASDHISTSKDDVEEVYNWLSGNMDQTTPSDVQMNGGAQAAATASPEAGDGTGVPT